MLADTRLYVLNNLCKHNATGGPLKTRLFFTLTLMKYVQQLYTSL